MRLPSQHRGAQPINDRPAQACRCFGQGFELLVSQQLVESDEEGAPDEQQHEGHASRQPDGETLAKGGLLSGTIVLTLNAECPAGFSRVQDLDGVFPKGASAAEPVGAVEFEATIAEFYVRNLGDHCRIASVSDVDYRPWAGVDLLHVSPPA